jgi:hypothetical protein
MTAPVDELAADGITIVRRFLSADDAAALRATVNDIYAFMNSGPIAHRQLRFHFNQWYGVWLGPLPKFLRRARPDLAQRYERALGAIEAQVKAAFGPDWRFFPKRSYFRCHIGMKKTLPWHIDADAASIFRLAGDAINVWMPLYAVGTDLPSLELVPHSNAVMRKVPLLAGKDRYRDDAFASAIGPALTPRLELGDALVFDQFTLHRTQHLGSDDTLRSSCEFRFVRGATPTLHALSGWLRYRLNMLRTAADYVAAKAGAGRPLQR